MAGATTSRKCHRRGGYPTTWGREWRRTLGARCQGADGGGGSCLGGCGRGISRGWRRSAATLMAGRPRSGWRPRGADCAVPDCRRAASKPEIGVPAVGRVERHMTESGAIHPRLRMVGSNPRVGGTGHGGILAGRGESRQGGESPVDRSRQLELEADGGEAVGHAGPARTDSAIPAFGANQSIRG